MIMKRVKGRSYTVDAVKGVLILFVVIGHAVTGHVHDVIYLFHMPLSPIISISVLMFWSCSGICQSRGWVK